MAAGFTLYRTPSGGSASEVTRTVTADAAAAAGKDCFGFALSSGSGTFSSFTDSVGNAGYTKDLDSTDAGTVGRIGLFRSLAITNAIVSGSTTLALTSSGGSFKGVAAGYMTGGSIGAFDKAGTKKNGTGTSLTTNSTGVLAQANEIGFAIFLFDGSPTFTEPVGWTNALGPPGTYMSTTSTVVNMAVCYIQTAATTALTPTATLGTSQNWGSIVGAWTWTDAGALGFPTPVFSLPLTGILIPGYPSFAPPIGTTQGPDPSSFDVVSAIPFTRFVNPLSLVMGPIIFPSPVPYFVFSGTSWVQSFSDTITLTDVIVKSIVLGKSDTTTLSDALVKLIGLSKSDTTTLADAISKAPRLNKSDTTTFSDSVVKSSGLVKTDTITLSDAAAKIVGLAKTDTVSMSDAVAKSVGLSKADQITLTDAISKALGKILADVETMSDSISISSATGPVNYTLSLSDTITLADSFHRYLTDEGIPSSAAARARMIFLSRFGLY